VASSRSKLDRVIVEGPVRARRISLLASQPTDDVAAFYCQRQYCPSTRHGQRRFAPKNIRGLDPPLLFLPLPSLPPRLPFPFPFPPPKREYFSPSREENEYRFPCAFHNASQSTVKQSNINAIHRLSCRPTINKFLQQRQRQIAKQIDPSYSLGCASVHPVTPSTSLHVPRASLPHAPTAFRSVQSLALGSPACPTDRLQRVV